MQAQSRQTTAPHAGAQDLATLVRERDWSLTALGPMDCWPQSLRTTVDLMLLSPVPLVLLWGSEGIMLYNDAYSVFAGQRHPQLLGSKVLEGWHEIAEFNRHVMEVCLAGGTLTYRDQYLVLHRRSSPEDVWMDLFYSPVPDESGSPAGVLAVVVETTQRVLSQRRLDVLRSIAARTSEARTVDDAAQLSAAACSKSSADIPLSLIYLFDSARKLARLAGCAGIPAGTPAAPETLQPGDAAPWAWEEALAQRSIVVCESGNFDPGASVGNVLVAPLEEGSQAHPAGFVIFGANPGIAFYPDYRNFFELAASGIARAVANAHAYAEERRRAEALAELDRAKTAFFSNISHEFRTPLTLMLGPVEELLARYEEPEQAGEQDLLRIVHRSGLRLQRLVNTLLDFARIEAGRVQASYEPVDLAVLTAELASGFRSAMERAGLRFTVDCPPLSQPVYVDRDMWEKVVLNLLSNAFKYTLDGSVTVRLAEVGGRAELTVADTGAGIPEAELPRLFERFHRVESVRGRTHEGTGIGLALVQELVRLHGGAVSVQSQPGEGSVFSVALPLGSAHLPQDRIAAARTLPSEAVHTNAYVEEAARWLGGESELPAEEGEAGPAAGPRSHVLLADDNADMRDYVQRLLGSRYRVTAACNGEEALAAALQDPPDLVLTDVMMPALDGFGLLAALRAHDTTKTLPVLMLSARAGEEARVEGMAAGADDYLIKPFTARELLARVEAHLSLTRMRREADLARRVSEMRLGLALEATGLLVWQWDPAKDEVQCSGDMERIFGVGIRSAAEGFRLVVPEDLPGHRAKVEQVAREGGSYASEIRIRRADTGQIVWLEERATGICDERGEVSLLVGVTADITDRKMAEIELRRQWDTFDTALTHTPDLICNFDRQGRFTYANRALLGVWQKQLDEIIGRNTYDLGYPPPLAERLQRQVQEVFESRQAIMDQTPFTGALGETRVYEYIFAPVLSADGSVDAVTCSARDITERQQFEQALAASEQRLQQVFEQAPVAIIVFRGPDYVVELANPVYQALLAGRNLVGRRFAEAVPELDKEVWDVFHQVMQGTPYTANDWYVTYDADGDGLLEDHWFNVNYQPFRESGEVTGFIAVLTEVTAQVRARQELEKVNRELEEFAYVASHDLQEPLRMISLYTQLLLKQFVPDNPAAADYAAFIRGGVRRMETLIRDLLTYSRTIQSEEQPAGVADLSAALREALAVLGKAVEETGARIETSALPVVRGDTGQLAHVFQNLLSNSLKYRKPDQTPEISVTAEKNGDRWVICVRDNGIGFKPEYAERIFGLFKRLHKEEYPGTGLGLAICQRIVERYDGRMWAESEPGRGAAFYFSLPAARTQ